MTDFIDKIATSGQFVDTTYLLPGNVIPHKWYKEFRLSDGSPDFIVINLLADVVAWWRYGLHKSNACSQNSKQHTPHFNGASLSVSYQYFQTKFFLAKERIRRALVRLEDYGIITRKVCNIKLSSGARINQLFIILDSSFFNSCFRNPELDIRVRENDVLRKSPSVSIVESKVQSPHEYGDHISKKNNYNRIRSMKSNFFEKSFEGNPLGNTENHFTSEIEVDLTNKSASSSKIKTLKDFYPLSLEDCNLLQIKSGREFSLLAMNEILKDMSNKLKDRAFKSKKAFMAYMSKAFSYELRDAVKINNENFRIRNNQSEEERGSNQIEEYLSKIEYSLQVSPEMHFKKKLCATLESKTAYELLRSYNSSKIDGDIFKIFVNKDVSLSNSEKEIIKNQAKASHESLDLATGNMITISDIEIIVSKQTYQSQNHKIQTHQVFGDQGNSSLTSDIKIKDDVWSKVRRELAGIYGEGVDQNWFAKLMPEINDTQKAIKLTAPSNFFKDWIDRNYKGTIDSLLQESKYSCLLEVV